MSTLRQGFWLRVAAGAEVALPAGSVASCRTGPDATLGNETSRSSSRTVTSEEMSLAKECRTQHGNDESAASRLLELLLSR